MEEKNTTPLCKPSVYAHWLGAIVLVAFIVIVVRNYNEIKNMNTYNLLVLLALTSIMIHVHGLSHIGLEKFHNYNPLNWFIKCN